MNKIINKLKEKIAYLEKIIAVMPGNIYWKDKNGVMLGCNNNNLKYLGLASQDNLIGKTDYDLLDRKMAAILSKVDQKVIKTGQTQYLEEPTTSDPPVIYLTQKVPLKDDQGDITGLVGISIDITERKRLEQELKEAEIRERLQEEKNKALKAVAASIAHEMRTPLASIYGAAQVSQYIKDLLISYNKAKEADLDVPFIRRDQIAAINDALKSIAQEVNLAQNVINMLLTNIKRLDTEQTELQDFSMVECITDALKRYPFATSEQDALINWQEQNDFHFKGDLMLINHILFNLLKNAFYYIAKMGKGKINIWLENQIDANELHFKDTGQGIAEEDLPHIFEHFYSKTPHGTGIGLAFCKQAMQQMGGNISCQSTYGEFAEFILSFPK